VKSAIPVRKDQLVPTIVQLELAGWVIREDRVEPGAQFQVNFHIPLLG
jgi:hypothetical protein